MVQSKKGTTRDSEKTFKSNVTLKEFEEKCQFGKDNAIFLGHNVGKDGIKIDPSKVVKEMQEPSDVTELRGFLNMVSQPK